MKKKTILILCASLLFVWGSTALCSSAVQGFIFEEATDVVQLSAFEPDFSKLAAYMGYDTDEKFEAFHKTALFMGKYCPSKKSFGYIEDLILSGYDVPTVMDIYQFYLTTNEDISLVKKIYDLVYHGEPIVERDIVFENAFNEITDNKCGVLTEEDVSAYLEQGLTVSDISEANLLCRKGVFTIQQILDAKINGASWTSIAEKICGENLSPDNSDISQLNYAMTIASVSDKSVNTVLTEEADDHFSLITEKINQSLKEKGFWRGRKSENFDKLLKVAKMKGASEENIEKIMNNGHSELEILNILNTPGYSEETFSTMAERGIYE